MDDCGQTFTFEALIFAALIIFGTVTIISTINPTQYDESIADNQLEADLDRYSQSLLHSLDERGYLKDILLNYNSTQFKDSTITDGYGGYYTTIKNTESGELLQRLLLNEGIKYNLIAEYGNSTSNQQYIVDNGEPTGTTVSTERSVIIFDDDMTISDTKIQDVNDYFINTDQFPDNNMYALVTIRVVVWV